MNLAYQSILCSDVYRSNDYTNLTTTGWGNHTYHTFCSGFIFNIDMNGKIQIVCISFNSSYELCTSRFVFLVLGLHTAILGPNIVIHDCLVVL